MKVMSDTPGVVAKLSENEKKVLLAAYRTKDYKWNRVTYNATGVNHADLVWETGLAGTVTLDMMESLAERGLLEFMRTNRGRIIPDNVKVTDAGMEAAKKLDASGEVKLLGPQLPKGQGAY